MVANTFPRSVAQDPVVASIARRASHVQAQIDRVSDPIQQGRLQGQLDAYTADLMDAVRAASSRLGEHVTITPDSMRLLIES